jgi:hypothetical protein
MPEFQMLATAAWFAISGAALFGLAHLYASGLIAASRLPTFLRSTTATLLYGGFGLAIVGPLAAVLLLRRANGTLFDESLGETVATFFAFVLSVIPALYVILVRRKSELRAAGWFTDEA